MRMINGLLSELFDDLERSFNNPEIMGEWATSTGFVDLNSMLGGGFSPGNLYFVAARPSMGKTALLTNIAVSIGLRLRKQVYYFSSEETYTNLIMRILSNESGVSTNTFRAGSMHLDQWQHIADAIARLSEAPLFFQEAPRLSEVLEHLQNAKEKPTCVFIDSLSSMIFDGAYPNVYEQIRVEVSKLKAWAIENNSAVVITGSVSKDVEGKQNKRPQLNDVADGNIILNASDAVIFIYRDDYYNPDSNDKNTAEIIIAKHRHGPTGTIKLYFELGRAKFANLSLDT